MASTNKTTTLDLSQFVGTDKPDWLTDYNGDMEKIDAWATVAESDISTATADASSAKTTANAASTAANQAVTTAGEAMTTANNTNANINSWKGTTTTTLPSGWNSGNFSYKYNKTLGILNFSSYMVSTANITQGQVVFTLPQEARPTTTIQIRGGAFIVDNNGNTANCTLSINNAGTIMIDSIISPSFNGIYLRVNVTLAAAGWGNNWPSLSN